MTLEDLTLDAALLQRVQGRLPDDPSKDTPETADLRRVLTYLGYACLILPQAAQRLKDGGEFLDALTKPFGSLAQVERP